MYGHKKQCYTTHTMITFQVSQAALADGEQDTSGINIAKLQEIMKEEDRIDKKLHAEKLKEKNW